MGDFCRSCLQAPFAPLRRGGSAKSGRRFPALPAPQAGAVFALYGRAAFLPFFGSYMSSSNSCRPAPMRWGPVWEPRVQSTIPSKWRW